MCFYWLHRGEIFVFANLFVFIFFLLHHFIFVFFYFPLVAVVVVCIVWFTLCLYVQILNFLQQAFISLNDVLPTAHHHPKRYWKKFSTPSFHYRMDTLPFTSSFLCFSFFPLFCKLQICYAQRSLVPSHLRNILSFLHLFIVSSSSYEPLQNYSPASKMCEC